MQQSCRALATQLCHRRLRPTCCQKHARAQQQGCSARPWRAAQGPVLRRPSWAGQVVVLVLAQQGQGQGPVSRGLLGVPGVCQLLMHLTLG
jgi:hypothetical protein